MPSRRSSNTGLDRERARKEPGLVRWIARKIVRGEPRLVPGRGRRPSIVALTLQDVDPRLRGEVAREVARLQGGQP